MDPKTSRKNLSATLSNLEYFYHDDVLFDLRSIYHHFDKEIDCNLAGMEKYPQYLEHIRQVQETAGAFETAMTNYYNTAYALVDDLRLLEKQAKENEKPNQ